MDCVVVETVKNPFSTPETRAVLTRLGTRLGRLVVEGRNALGYVVLRCDCGETVALTSKQVAAGKRYQCDSCDTWDRKPLIRKYLGDEIYHNIRRRGVHARQRCENPSNPSFSDYGGRGIKFDYDSLDQYTLQIGILAQIHGLDKQVDRINNDGNYAPDNTRLVSVKTNMRNRRNTIIIDGVPLHIIAENNGLDPSVDKTKYCGVWSRLKYVKSSRDISIDEVIEVINDFKTRKPKANLRKRNPYRKLMVGEISLAEYISKMGFPGNRPIYDAAKCLFRGGRCPTEEDIRDHVTLYAIKKNISGNRKPM